MEAVGVENHSTNRAVYKRIGDRRLFGLNVTVSQKDTQFYLKNVTCTSEHPLTEGSTMSPFSAVKLEL